MKGKINTEHGTMVLEFYEKDAPNTVNNFVKLSKMGFYEGLTFHRVIPGFVSKDATSSKEKVLNKKYYHQHGLPKNVGILKREVLSDVDNEIVENYDIILDFLRKNKVNLVEIELPYFEYCIATYYILTMAEASSNLSRFDGIRYGSREKASNLDTTYTQSRSKGFGPEVKRRIITGTYILSSGYYDAYYSKALKVRRLIKEEYNKLFSKLDCMFIPTTASPSFHLKANLDDPMKMYLSDMFTVPVNLIGSPSLNIPGGETKKNLPIGFQIVGDSFKEETLFRFAHSLERAKLFE